MSVVSICNQALSWLGVNPITSLDDDLKQAALCKTNYPPIRDAVLERGNWSFAKKRVELAAEVATPAFEYAYQYPLPSDCLRVLSINKYDIDDETLDWQLEDNKILTNQSTCKIVYISQVTNPNKFSALFTQALAARIAADLAIPLTQSRTLQEAHYKLFSAKISEARAMDGGQGKSKRLRSRWLLKARRSGYVRSVAGPVV